MLMGLSALAWGFGQIIWSYYEVVLGKDVPFPSIADVGYLSMVPFAVAAMLKLPAGSQSLAGRIRTVLDGIIIGGSLLLISWLAVLGRVFDSDASGMLSKTISLAYPLGDVVVVTIVLYVILRARESQRKVPVALVLVGCGLVALAVSDSGFAYLTATDSYSSGNFIDTGWFVGFLMILMAARTPAARRGDQDDLTSTPGRPTGLMLPYVAVVLALVTSGVELLRRGRVDSFVSWNRSFIIAMACSAVTEIFRAAVSCDASAQSRQSMNGSGNVRNR